MLWNPQGKPDETETLVRKALSVARTSLDPNHPQLAADLHILGTVYEAQAGDKGTIGRWATGGAC